MKKFGILGLLIGLAACSNVDLVLGTDRLVELQEEPKTCKYLYEITSTTSVYQSADAKKYLLNQIVEMDTSKGIQSNAYLITESEVKENPDAILGPKNSYMNKAKVYLCPMYKSGVVVSAPENSLKLHEVEI